MQRNEWTFTYTATKLADAAEIKVASHKGRLDWWGAKKEEVMKKVRESGIEIHDSVAASYSNTKGAFGPQIQIDPLMQRDLSECQTKILEHTNKVSEYEGWVQVLRANPEARLELNHDDWLFYFGG